MKDLLAFSPKVEAALATGKPVVALESTIITHGMPYPQNLDVARKVEATVRDGGAVPATIAVIKGQIHIGLDDATLEALAATPGDQVMKLSRADLAACCAMGRTGATTVAATMICAALAGIRVFATGGIGGVHRGAELSFDISADLQELALTPVTVVAAGAKAILDLPKTLEVLETLGVPIFQEQAMKIAMVAAQFDAEELDQLRKAMATFRSRGTIDQLQDKMVGRMIARGYDPTFAERCFNQIKGFGDYGFPESHATAFAHLAYISAYLKCHYPAAFAAALLNSQPMGFYAPAQIVRDASEHGVTVLPVDVNFSAWDNTLQPVGKGFALRLGLRQIEGLANTPGLRVQAAGAEAPFADMADLKTRARLDARTIRLIAAADALRSVDLDRRAGLWQARALRDAPDLPLFDDQPEGHEAPVTLPDMPLCEHVTADYQTLRLSLKRHPMAFLRASMAEQGYVSAKGLDALPGKTRLRMAGLVLIRQRPGSAKGVCFVTLEDETGVANLVLWKRTFDAFRRVAMTARLMEVYGEIQRAEGVTHVVAHWIGDRSDALLRLSGDAPQGRLTAPRAGHPRDARIVPRSRDFH